MTLCCFLQFINVCVPLLMINLNFDSVDWVRSLHNGLDFDFAGPRKGGELFFGGRHRDITRDFIRAVSWPLRSILYLHLIMTLFSEFTGSLLYAGYVNVQAGFAVLQVEADQTFEGRDFRLPSRLGSQLAFVMSVLLWSTALPDLLFLIPIYFTLTFWTSKWQILRICKLPPRYDMVLIETATSLLGLSVLLHIFVSVLTFTAAELFPSQVLVDNPMNKFKYFYVESLSFTVRLLDPRVSSFLLLFLGTIGVFFIVEPLAMTFVRGCCFPKPRRGQRVRKGAMRNYSVESVDYDKVGNNAAFTYDVLQQKNYRRAFLLLNEQDIDEADDELDKVRPTLDNVLHPGDL